MDRLRLILLCFILLLPAPAVEAQQTVGERVLRQRAVLLSRSRGIGELFGVQILSRRFPFGHGLDPYRRTLRYRSG